MEIIGNISGYPVSKDYAELFNLAKKQSVVCVVDYSTITGPESRTKRDVAQTISFEGQVNICARGISYIAATSDPEEFTSYCEEINLEWIVPSFGD